jgi:ABC-type amino acid transport substrate-binding protein
MASQLKWALVAALAAFGLTACGGGGSDGYGSIAVSESTSYVAIVTGGVTQSFANDAARDKCDEDDCKVVLQFEQCGAAAASNNATGQLVIAVAAGGSAFDAQTAANQSCTANGGLACGPIPNLPAQCN